MQVKTSRESLDALKRAAEAAMAFTAETWRASPNAFGVLNTVDMGTPPTSPFIVVHSDCGGHGAVIAFIVAAQPSAVMALLAERDAATARAEAAERERDEFQTRSIAMHRRVSKLESGATYRWLVELREQFRKERDAAIAKRDRMRAALEKAAIAAEIESAGHAIAIIEAALTSAKEG